MLCELWLSQRYLKKGKKEKIISLTAFISMIGIAIGVLVLIVVIAVMSGFDVFLQDKMVGTNAHMFVEFYSTQQEPMQVASKLRNIRHVLATAPYIAGQAFIKNGPQVFSVDFRGIDPELQPKVSKLQEYIKQGSLQIQDGEVLLGEELALRLGVGLGDKVSLISPVTLKQADFLVKGLFNSGMYLYDSGLIMTTIKGAQDFFKIGNLVSGIALKVDDIYKVEDIKIDIYNAMSGIGQYEIKTWVDLNRNFLQALKLEKVMMFIILTMTTVVAAFGIASTLIMSVMTKIKDIGILRSVGAKTKSILQIFILQGLSVGITGIVLGLIGGIGLTLSLNNIVDFISRLLKRPLIPRDIYYFDKIPTNINTGDITTIVICTLIISLIASIYPAYYAARINPSEAVRHE
jgi:lipoprotein-releasing system permease protein